MQVFSRKKEGQKQENVSARGDNFQIGKPRSII